MPVNSDLLFQRSLTILQDVLDEHPDHPGETFMTPYQIAIALKRQPFAADYEHLEVGGKDLGEDDSLAKRVANVLSVRYTAQGEASGIQRGFLSNQDLDDIHFRTEEGSIASSKTHNRRPLSIFRARPTHSV